MSGIIASASSSSDGPIRSKKVGFSQRFTAPRKMLTQRALGHVLFRWTHGFRPSFRPTPRVAPSNGPAIKKVCANSSLGPQMGCCRSDVRDRRPRSRRENSLETTTSRRKDGNCALRRSGDFCALSSQPRPAICHTAAGDATGPRKFRSRRAPVIASSSAPTNSSYCFVPPLICAMPDRCRAREFKSDLPYGQRKHQTGELWRDLTGTTAGCWPDFGGRCHRAGASLVISPTAANRLIHCHPHKHGRLRPRRCRRMPPRFRSTP